MALYVSYVGTIARDRPPSWGRVAVGIRSAAMGEWPRFSFSTFAFHSLKPRQDPHA